VTTFEQFDTSPAKPYAVVIISSQSDSEDFHFSTDGKHQQLFLLAKVFFWV